MKKRIALLFYTFFVVSTLTACGQTGTDIITLKYIYKGFSDGAVKV